MTSDDVVVTTSGSGTPPLRRGTRQTREPAPVEWWPWKVATGIGSTTKDEPFQRAISTVVGVGGLTERSRSTATPNFSALVVVKNTSLCGDGGCGANGSCV